MWSQKHCRVLLAARSIAPIAEALVRSRELTHLLVSCDRSLVPEKAIPHGFRPPLGKHSDLRAELFPGEPDHGSWDVTVPLAPVYRGSPVAEVAAVGASGWVLVGRGAGAASVPARHQCRRGISAGGSFCRGEP